MCFSYPASVSAASAGIVSAVLVLYFVHDRVQDPFVGRSAAVLPALLVTPALVQLCDAAAHSQQAMGAERSSWLVGIACYLSIMIQPVILSSACALLLGGDWGVVLWSTVAVAAVSVVGSLLVDRPLGTWLALEVVEREGRLANVVHGAWAYDNGGGLFGAKSRAAVYFATLGVGFVALVVLAMRVHERAGEDMAEPVAVYMLGLGASLWALFLLSEVVAQAITRVRNHASSVWCALSLVGTVTFGIYLTTARAEDRGFGGFYVVAVLGTYVAAYALAATTRTDGEQTKASAA
jgi:hypothetical protein